jgi:hypothetical protein
MRPQAHESRNLFEETIRSFSPAPELDQPPSLNRANELQGETHRDTQKRCLRVIAKPQEVKAMLLSLNEDFADIVTCPPTNYERIVVLRPLFIALSSKHPSLSA